ncbi:MAG: methyl-accepting chemotaxis protein [Xanthobacteraceae bacterium]|nr:MAG: methyl-accepting chemotaxis protein [Xanthobacteraceae bacterium]
MRLMPLRLPRVHFGLRYQIAMLCIGGVLLVGAIYVAGLRTQEYFQRSADESALLRNAMAQVAQGLLEARQTETEFLRRPEEKLIARREELLALMGRHLDEVERKVASLDSGDPLKRAEAIRPGLQAYITRFHNVTAAQHALGMAAQDGLEGRLHAAVVKAEERLSRLDQPGIALLMLRMRQQEKDYLLRGEQKYADALQAAGRNVSGALEASALEPADRKDIARFIDSYMTTFMGFTVGRDALKEEVDDLALIYSRLWPLVVEVSGVVEQRYEAAQDAIAASRRDTTTRMLWAIGLAIVCAGALSIYVGQRTTKPLDSLAKAMEQLVSGDLDVQVPRLTRRDEIGMIGRAFVVFHEAMVENRMLTAAQQTAKDQAEAERRQMLLDLARQLEIAVSIAADEMMAAVDEMKDNAHTVNCAVRETRGRIGAVAAAFETAVANAQMTATAVDGISASLAGVVTQVERSTDAARRAADEAMRTDMTVRSLAVAADRIGVVVELINAIAGKTNLLALNATIEAVRAGPSGRGFAVVANEVKALAAQSATAAEEIRAQIAAIQDATQGAVNAIGNIGGTVQEVDTIATAIAEIIQQEQRATKEIAQNVTEGARGTQDVSESISGVSRDAERAWEAAEKAKAVAERVASRSADMRDTIGRFIDHVRAG